MTDETLTDVLKFQSEIDEKGNIQIPQEKLKQLHDKGFKKVQVVIFGSAKDAASEKGIDEESFELIRELQSLPDSVVLDFLHARGRLSKSDIKERIKF